MPFLNAGNVRRYHLCSRKYISANPVLVSDDQWNDFQEPKIVIAVFEEADYNYTGGGSPGGGGGTTPTGGNISAGGGLSSTTGAKPTQIVYAPSPDATPEIPEPATGILLGLGSILLLKSRRRNKFNARRN